MTRVMFFGSPAVLLVYGIGYGWAIILGVLP